MTTPHPFLESMMREKFPCEVCKGDGFTAEHGNHNPETGECLNCPIQEQCEVCEATGYKYFHLLPIFTSFEKQIREDRDKEWGDMLKKHPDALIQLQGEIALKKMLPLPILKIKE